MKDSEIHSLAAGIISEARTKGLTIATAESCTGGWIGKALTDIAGSSRVYKGSLVAYHNSVKENLLGVSKDTMIKHGAVSEDVATEMAKNCTQIFGVDIAVSVTGIAGPGGGAAEKPVGLVHMAVAQGTDVQHHRFEFKDPDRESIRREAVMAALKLIKAKTSE